MNPKLSELRSAIIAKVPSILDFPCDFCGKHFVGGKGQGGCGYCINAIGYPDITLADVLMATCGKIMIDGYGVFHEDRGQSGEHGVYEDEIIWELSLPLDSQSPECIDFLHQLLNPSPSGGE